jgi:hypothetical protein
MSAPSVSLQRAAGPLVTSPKAQASTWALANLKPDEKTIFIDGTSVPFSVDMNVADRAGSTSQYALVFSIPRKAFRPFLIKTMGGSGEIMFCGTVTWFASVSGINETATMALYHVERSESGRTETKTLLKQIRTTYQVVCNKDEFILIIALKKLFGRCTEAPQKGTI